MKLVFVSRLALVCSVLIVSTGCGKDEPAPSPVGVNPQQPGYPQQPSYPQQPGYPQPGVPAPVQPAAPAQVESQNPLGALAGALGGMMGGQPQGAAPVAMIPWQTLSQALPLTAPGWIVAGQVKGESANMMGIAVSTASVELVSGAMQAKVDIVDTTMNPLIAMPFNMARAVQVDSTEERMGAVTLGGYPATQKLDKRTGAAEVITMVGNRVMVTVHVNGAGSEQPALALAQMVNYPHLAAAIPR